MMSETLRRAIKLHPKRHYQIAQEAGLHPSTLSKLMNGIVPIYEDDPRVIKIARVLGLDPEDCFDKADH